jgi:hypothetical protein
VIGLSVLINDAPTDASIHAATKSVDEQRPATADGICSTIADGEPSEINGVSVTDPAERSRPGRPRFRQ